MVKMEKHLGSEGMSGITQRLSRQSLDENDALSYLSDTSDSGAESDKENSTENVGSAGTSSQIHQPLFSSSSPVISSSTKRPFQPLTSCRLSHNNSLVFHQSDHQKLKSCSSSPHPDNSPRSSFELESRGTGDFMPLSWGSPSLACMEMDGYNSEDELASINCNNPVQIRPGGKRTWSKVNCNTGSSGIWSDDGTNDMQDSPLHFSASPPKGVRLSHTMSPKRFLASVLPHNNSLAGAPYWKKPR